MALARCPACALHFQLCICALHPPLDIQTRVVVLMHHREFIKHSNTGRLVPLALKSGEVRLRGLKNRPTQTAGLLDPARRVWMLYPTEDAQVITPELVAADPRPITLIVPDGNWRQARKVHRREAALTDVPRVCLAPSDPSNYRLRSHPDPKRIATLEAIARALAVIENEAVEARLLHWFNVMVERTLWTRGTLPADQVEGGIPPRS